ncbi:response regulator [Microseira sp. BLCC-F43]|jgi:chemosensory pili system protein ChpA (sensor histidine kinase/response regulator)|uniref:hybrid sensor histidine kinase/response regulator n=1 Tax=Microseira sp. BLCC-F43 TaxID=3153602 RepID=UPI0035B6C51C
MSQEKELQIKRQFLEEAQDYLGTLEAVVLGLAERQVETEKINAALRAAHSIKGGAGMMGFGVLSHLAHRLEDSLKVLKTQKNLQIDPQLEELLLAGVDCLRYAIAHNRQGHPPDPVWIATQADPVFEQLGQRLGEALAEDATTMLFPEDGQDAISLLFETEVEGCLQRLESVLADPQLPCLHEELEILAQELGGLGEMLQLNRFSQLCESVTQQLAAAPEQVEAIAHSAVQAWRQSQALILTGQFALLPTAIALSDQASRVTGNEEAKIWAATDTQEDEPLTAATSSPALPLMRTQPVDGDHAQIGNAGEAGNEADRETFSLSPYGSLPLRASGEVEEESVLQFDPFWVKDVPRTAQQWGTTAPEVYTTDWQTLEVKQDEPATPPTSADSDATVRVPLKYLDQLNDLFGELTIERNGLALELKRLRSLFSTLSHRLPKLEQANSQLRFIYDRSATGGLATGKGKADNSSATAFPSAMPERMGETLQGFDLLEMDRYGDLHFLGREVMETIVQIQEVVSDIELSLEDVEQTSHNLGKTTKQMQKSLKQVRMRPLADILTRFPRALRELSLHHGKPVELKIYGQNTLVDRNILEVLQDPLMHLLRNAFDHGIEDPKTRLSRGKPESGLIEIKASHRGNRTLISIKDDGEGIPFGKIRQRAIAMGLDADLLASASDRDLLSLIFEPGFTTKEEVSNLSGRGVGMDVVRNNLKQIRGEIQVDTQPGVGTTFTITLPFTLSVTRVLLTQSNGMLLAFPTDAIQQIVSLEPEQVLATAGSEVLNLEGKMVPLLRLDPWLKFDCPRHFQELETPPTISRPVALIVTGGDKPVGIFISCCWSDQEVAVRQVEGDLPLPSGFSSCAILGDGRVVPLLDVPEFLRWSASRVREASAPGSRSGDPITFLRARLENNRPTPALPAGENTILIVDDSINVRRFLALTLEKAGYQVEQARDGQDALDKLQGGLNVTAAICDIEMPHIDGYGFLAQVKANANFKQMPVIMLTSRTGDKHRELAMNLGAAAYFSKPYNEQALLKMLETLTSQPQSLYP